MRAISRGAEHLLVAHDHLVAALPAVDEPVQQRLAATGNATAVLTPVVTMVVLDHRPNSLVRGPVDVSGILVADTDLPLVHGQPLPRRSRMRRRAGPAIGKRAGIGWVLQQRAD